LGHIEPEIEL